MLVFAPKTHIRGAKTAFFAFYQPLIKQTLFRFVTRYFLPKCDRKQCLRLKRLCALEKAFFALILKFNKGALDRPRAHVQSTNKEK